MAVQCRQCRSSVTLAFVSTVTCRCGRLLVTYVDLSCSLVPDTDSHAGESTTGLRQRWSVSLPTSTCSQCWTLQHGWSFTFDAPSDHITDSLPLAARSRSNTVHDRLSHGRPAVLYKVLHGSAPLYLRQLTPVTDLLAWRALRSACTNRLVMSSVRRSTTGCRASPVTAPRTWNTLQQRA